MNPMPARRLPLKRLLVTSLLSMGLLLAAGWFGGRWYLAGSVLDSMGQAELAGLDAPVEVQFDARGIPRIRSRTDADALRTLGWLHAAERGLQPGDVILSVGDKEVAAPSDVEKLVNSAKEDGLKAVLLRIKSGDQTRFVALTFARA